ncbi:MAG: isochorismatase family cysteine hydrolase [Nitrososphaeraceae archaeon]
MFAKQLGKRTVNIALVVVDMQNGFVSPEGSYGKLGMNLSHYRSIIPKVRELIDYCRKVGIPIFYTEAVREASGIDLLTHVHILLPKSREETHKVPICIRGTWDGNTIDELKPTDEDHLIIKRRDGAFQDTELRMWLQSLGVNALVFCGVDTSICVETSLREAFNLGYDIMLISDATASGNQQHYKTTLERVGNYYGIALNFERFKKMIDNIVKIDRAEAQAEVVDKGVSAFCEEFGLLDIRKLI